MRFPIHLHADKPIAWRDFATRLTILTLGTLIAAVAVIVFYAPFEIAPAGITGLAVIINKYIDFPIGIAVMLGNIPILYLAYRMLGGWQAVIGTTYIIVLFSVSIDILIPYFPSNGVSDDLLLNAIFAGAVGGVGGGFVYRTGATFGGTTVFARILQMRLGISMSSTYLYANLGIVVLAGIFLGWESALYSLVALMMEGIASDYVLEGPGVIRTATIITNKPQEVADIILHVLQRGVTGWEGTGMYTQQPRHILFVTILRSQSTPLKDLVQSVDPDALIIIGQGHVAYGAGFKRAKNNNGNKSH